LAEDCRHHIQTCRTCQLKAPVTYRDRVPIKPIPRDDRVFDHWFIDCAGPFFSAEGQKVKYTYAFIAVDSFSRFPVWYALKSLTAKSVSDALLELWQFTGCCSYVSSDLGTNFTSQLTREFEKRMGCSPRFNSPWHPSSTGFAERAVGNVKTIVFKLAMDHPKQWQTYLPMAMWYLREVPNESTGLGSLDISDGSFTQGSIIDSERQLAGVEIKIYLSVSVKMRPNIYTNSTKNWKSQKLMPRLMLNESKIDTLRITVCAVVTNIFMSENKF